MTHEPLWSDRVSAWAKRSGLSLRTAPPVAAEVVALVPELLQADPESPIQFTTPVALREFWRTHGGARVEKDADEEYPRFTLGEFWVFSPDELVDVTQRWVRIPSDVSHGNRRITRNHLVGFACDQDIRSAVWCFDTAAPQADGGYPIVSSRSEGAARFTDTGDRVYDTPPAFSHFHQWFDRYVDELCARDRDELLGFA